MDLTTVSRREWFDLEGHVITRGHDPGFVVLSFFISYIGALTTLELINKRTSQRGLYNWFFLLVASLSMGGVAIWSMHIIGNRAIILGNGESQIQIAYSAGFTTLSFFVPVIVLFLAFSAVGINEEVSYVRLVVGGSLAGLGICGMHYLGQASITNYECIYAVANVVGAAIIAIVASIVALGVFFVFRSAWGASWWKRAICALILAGAVSGMHWLASVGTKYRLKSDVSGSNPHVRDAMTIAVIALSMGTCVIYLSLATLIFQARKLRAASRAQQIVLATAIFDRDGKLLVTSGGTLPNQKITSSYREQTANDTFGIAHPTFLWMFRTTHNWTSVKDLIGPMKIHLQRSGLRNRFGAEADAKLVNEQGMPIQDYHLVFRELFCTAAADLADELHQPLDKVGVMFDEIIHTGRGSRSHNDSSGKAQSLTSDLERDGKELETLSSGQLLFLVREADRQEAEHLQATGYRFALPTNVIPILSGTFQVAGQELLRQLENMREYVKSDQILDPGIHLAFFAVKASIGAGFDVLARRDARNQLPTIQLPFDTLESWQLDYLRNMEGSNVSTCLNLLRKASESTATTEKERLFASRLFTCLEALRNQIGDPIFNDACLMAQPVYAPCRGHTEDSRPGRATLISFKLILPVGSRAPGPKLDFVPLSFFKMQQLVFKNAADHAVFARKTYREFAPALDLSGRPSIVGTDMSKGSRRRRFGSGMARMETEKDCFGVPVPHLTQNPAVLRKSSFGGKFFKKRNSETNARVKGDNSSERNLVEHLTPEDHPLGGIMVSQEVDVDSKVEDKPLDSAIMIRKEDSSIEMSEMQTSKTGVVSNASKEEELESYVDELFKLCMQSR